MPASIRYSELRASPPGYRLIVGALIVLLIAGLFAAHHMDVEGHHVSGMNNQIVWGLPHVFAIFLILAASGALNLASLASVFGRPDYAPLARLSAISAIALLIGGLVILLLDLGRPDRLIIALSHYNFRSIFAWNIILYGGFFILVAVYLWLLIERRLQAYSKPLGLIALIWRLLLTTGTGLIFGFLLAREAYDTALMAPMFIAMSLAFGLALFILLMVASFKLDDRVLADSHLHRLRRLLGIMLLAVIYCVILFHLTRLYSPQNHAVEYFLLLDGGVYTALFWWVQIGLGSLLPLLLIYLPTLNRSRRSLLFAAALVTLGAFAQLYVIIVGGQAYPLNLFPGYEVSSSFYDGVLADYAPSAWEWLLGLGGMAASILIVLFGIRLLPLVPEILPDDAPLQARDGS